MSDIRPYFRKIWLADRTGGCSNDILALKTKNNCNSGSLYYLLSENCFFDYATATAKGTKMPRGDKSTIMLYEVPDFSLKEQECIYEMLASFDAKIA